MTANDASDLVRSWLDTLVRLEWIRDYRVVSVVVDGEESTVSVEVLPQMYAKVVDVTLTFDKQGTIKQ